MTTQWRNAAARILAAFAPTVTALGRFRVRVPIRGLADAAFGVVLAYFVLVGGTDAGRVFSLKIINAGLGAALVAVWIIKLRGRADRVDALVIVALVAYLATAVLGTFPRFGLEAAVDGLAYAALFAVARREVHRQAFRRAVLYALAVAMACLSVAILSLWGPIWLAWIAATGTTPLLDTPLPVGWFRHPHVVAMTIALCAPAAAALMSDRAARPIAAIAIACGTVIVIMAGGRGVWFALVGAAAITFGLRIRMTRKRAIGLGALAASVVLAAVASGLAVSAVARLASTYTLAYRWSYWQEALDLWLEKPLVGWGPGTFGITMTLSDFFETNTYLPRHADNAVIQAAAEGGLLGVGALAVIVIALFRGARWSFAESRFAVAALVLFALLSATDNPTDSPGLVVVGVMWAAIAAPADPLAPSIVRRRPVTFALTSALAITVGISVLVMLAAAWSFERARNLAQSNEVQAGRALELAVALDPAMPLYRRELGAHALRDGRLQQAIRELGLATKLNPADAAAFRAEAIALQQNGDDRGAIAAAMSAVERRRSDPVNLLTLAAIASEAGDWNRSREALIEVLIQSPWTAASTRWQAHLPAGHTIGELLNEAVERATDRSSSDPAWDHSNVWLKALAGVRSADPPGALGVIDHTLRCELRAAHDDLGALPSQEQFTFVGNMAVLLFGAAAGDDSAWERGLEISSLRLAPLDGIKVWSFAPLSPLDAGGEDVRLYGLHGMEQPPAVLELPDPSEGWWTWIRNPQLAAARAAPDSAIGHCNLEPLGGP